MTLSHVFRQFDIEGKPGAFERLGAGHINDTFAVESDRGSCWVLQRINRKIFTDPPALMENICRVTDHIRARLIAEGLSDVDRRVLRVIPARSGDTWFRDDDGEYWRCYPLVERAHTVSMAEHESHASAAAFAFGRFVHLLADLPGAPLHETIPHFHDGKMRLAAFHKALTNPLEDRLTMAARDIAFLEEHAWMFDVLPREVAAGRISSRVTHNDTKINNVMLDNDSGEGLCVIDLDTVMDGLVLYDFGDLVRSSIGTAAEDEPDTRAVQLHEHVFEALLRGYLAGAGPSLNEAERQHLTFSAPMMTLLIGTRFLTDYLAGDTYFRTTRPRQNLDRARVQFRLVQLMLERKAKMDEIVTTVFEQNSRLG